jgi:hypothetical protein
MQVVDRARYIASNPYTNKLVKSCPRRFVYCVIQLGMLTKYYQKVEPFFSSSKKCRINFP